MICNKCKKKVAVNKSVCPYCNNSLVKKMHSSNNGSKNKLINNDDSFLVGGTVTKGKGAFIKLKKDKKHDEIKQVQRKDFVNYLDYKEAKDEQQDKKLGLKELKNKKYTEKDVSTKLFSIEKVKRSSKINKGLLKHRDDYSNLTGSTVSKGYDTGINKSRAKKTKKSKVDINYDETFIISKKDFDKEKFIGIKVSDKTGNKVNRSLNKEFAFLKYAVLISVWFIAIIVLINTIDSDYYFGESISNLFGGKDTSEDYLEYDGVSKSGQVGGNSSNGVTAIVYDNQYLSQFVVNDKNDVYELIVADSEKQKVTCPANILAVEDEIINNYGIVAVNLCEMDETFAKELRDVVAYIYDSFPSARYYLTNLTLANVDSNSSFMAAFMPIFKFATSNTETGYPLATKTQILLNAKYFLNSNKVENSVDYGVRSGYFPANATRSSTLIHEFGHYLSYVALLNYYNSDGINYVKASDSSKLYQIYDDFNAGNYSLKLLEEAYREFLKDTGSGMSFYQFRESISQYAVAKDSDGSYIYDETIAEAFHDYYLNGPNAAPASIAIMKVLNSKL